MAQEIPATLDAILAHLDGVRRTSRGFSARCPAHDDRTASLSIRARDSGDGVLVHCFAGCTYRDVADALGLQRSPTASVRQRPVPALEAARAAILAEARRQPWARMVEHYDTARWVRAGFHRAHALRRAGHQAGDTEPGWALLVQAAAVERATLALEGTL